MKRLNEWAAIIHANAVEHGWWDEERSFGEIVALCHSELSEALEEYRNKKPNAYCVCKLDDFIYGVDDPDCWNDEDKPEGIAVEMIDCVIRILDWCGANCIDVDALMEAKHAYNRTRPYRHGGKTI